METISIVVNGQKVVLVVDIYASPRVALPTLIGKVVVADLPTSIIALTADMILITDKKTYPLCYKLYTLSAL